MSQNNPMAGAAGQAAALPATPASLRWHGLTEVRFHVVLDIPLKPGTLVHGAPVPAGAWLRAYPLATTHTRGQMKKALRRIRRRHPAARGVKVRFEPGDDHSPASLDLKGTRTSTQEVRA